MFEPLNLIAKIISARKKLSIYIFILQKKPSTLGELIVTRLEWGEVQGVCQTIVNSREQMQTMTNMVYSFM